VSIPTGKATAEQRERVLALIEGGFSYRAVAEEVFGEARYRGRVERIVRASREPSRRLGLGELRAQLEEELETGGSATSDSWLEQLVPLYGRALKRRLDAGEPVSGRELLALANLEARLETKRTIERLNALLRE
jgi:hypothetical protein